MSVEEQLLAIQWEQSKHDELYHKEIVLLPVGDRMKHFALHMAKYAGYLADTVDSEDDPRFERALVDAFIISVAAANTLGLDLGRALARDEGVGGGLGTLGEGWAKTLCPEEQDKGGIWFLRQFARCSGRLAKACESLDHIESHPFREEMRASVLDLFKLVVAEASARRIDLPKEWKERLQSIEAKHLFKTYYEKESPSK
jgi:hypothetical protein